MNERVTFTLWPSLTDTTHPTQVTDTWPPKPLNKHIELSDKHSAPGFGPYTLNRPKREDTAVQSMTLLVFDADQGTDKDIGFCQERFTDLGFAALFYTTFSYSQSSPKQAYRIVVPLKQPLDPLYFDSVRAHAISEFSVPAAITQCSGHSHFYYLPSKPPGAPAFVYDLPGSLLDPFELWPEAQACRPPPTRKELRDYEPPEEPDAPVRLTQAKGRLAKRVLHGDRLGDLVAKALAGKPLAEHGNRTVAMRDLTNLLVFMFPKYSIGTLFRLIRQSLDVMQADGSRLSDSRVERMFLGAMRKRAELDAGQDQLLQDWEKEKEQFLATIPTVS